MNFSVYRLKPMFGLLAFALIAGAINFASLAVGPVTTELDALFWLAAVQLSALVLKSWLPQHARLGVLGLVLAYLIGSVGLAEASTVSFWLASVFCAGLLVLRWCYSRGPDADISATEAFLVGVAIWLAVLGAMLHFPLNYRSCYLGLALLPFLCLYGLPKRTAVNLRSRAAELHAWMHSIPFWAWCLGLAVIGWSLRWAAFPTLAYDDHAGHLRLWTELLTEKRALFDVRNQVWSVAPFASDLLYASLSLMAGADARSATNLLLAIVLLALMVRILHQLRVPATTQWMLIVLMASTPMLGNLLLTMQTELALAALGLAGLRLVLDARGGWRGQHVLGILACSALCAAIKLPGVIFGATMLLALAVRLWAERGSIPALSDYLKWPALMVLLVLAFVAAHSYAMALRITGNPFFPLYNAIFKSPFAPIANFSDPRWMHGFGIRSYVRVFFHTSEFFECANYTAGWQYLLLLPVSLLALWRSNTPANLRLALVPLLGFGLAMFAATQYWRYMFPVMPIACIVMASLFVGENRTVRAAFAVLATVCILLNLIYYPQISWMMESPAGLAYTQAKKQDLAARYAPVALLTEKVNQSAPGSRVLYPERTPFGASLHGSPLYLNWYSPSRSAQFAAIKTAGDLEAFLQQDKVDFAILALDDAETSNVPKKLLREHMARYASAVAQEGSYVLYGLKDTATLYRKVFDLKQPAGITLQIPVSDQGLAATTEPKVLANLPVLRAGQAHYAVRFHCPSQAGFFVAQINWDKGAPYYRLVACETNSTSFEEAVPIPSGASKGDLYATARDTAAVEVEELAVEVN